MTTNHPKITITIEFHPNVAMDFVAEHRNRLYESAMLAVQEDVASEVTISSRWVPDE